MSNKTLTSESNETKMLFSKIEEARGLAKRLGRLSRAVKSATQKRDAALYKYFAKLHYLAKRLRRLNPPRNKLEEKYGRLPRSTIPAVLKLTYPSLHSKRRSTYATLLQYVRDNKERGQSVKSLLRKTGGINKSVTAERKLRNKTRKGKGAK